MDSHNYLECMMMKGALPMERNTREQRSLLTQVPLRDPMHERISSMPDTSNFVQNLEKIATLPELPKIEMLPKLLDAYKPDPIIGSYKEPIRGLRNDYGIDDFKYRG